MVKGADGALEKLWQAEKLIDEGRIDTARPLVVSFFF